MQLHINPHDEAPVYRQIQRQIATAIAERRIHPGELLQSQEDLATQLAVSPSAVRKAYEELRSDGLCDGSRKGRYRVSTPELGSVEGGNAGPPDSKEWLDRLLDQVSQRTGAILDDDWTAVLLEYHRPLRKN